MPMTSKSDATRMLKPWMCSHRELEQLARDYVALLEALPHTADGVPIVPGMKVYYGTGSEWVVDRAREVSATCSCHGQHWMYPPGSLYSTREAALAANVLSPPGQRSTATGLKSPGCGGDDARA